MTYAQKVTLAKHYSAIFTNHWAVGTILLLIITILGIFAVHHDWCRNPRNPALGMIGMLMVLISVLILEPMLICTDAAPSDEPNINSRIDKTIVCDDSRLQKVSKETHYYSRISSHSHGNRKYHAEYMHYIYYRKSKSIKHYLQTHKPEKPWINSKF